MTFLVVLGVLALVAAAAILVARGRRGEDATESLPDGAEGYLPTEFLFEIANPKRLNTIQRTGRGQLRMSAVEEESDENGGVGGYVTICVDTRGIVALKDGHHRLLYARKKGIERLPVYIRQSTGIKSHGKHITEVLPLLLSERKVREPETSGG